MKQVLASLSLVLASGAASASVDQPVLECFSYEEMGPVFTVTVGQERKMGSPWGPNETPHWYMAYPTIVREYDKSVYVDGIGDVTAEKVDLDLLIQGDMIMGALKADRIMDSEMFTGTLQMMGINNNKPVEIGCKQLPIVLPDPTKL